METTTTSPAGCYTPFFSTYKQWINATATTTATSTAVLFNVTANASYTATSECAATLAFASGSSPQNVELMNFLMIVLC